MVKADMAQADRQEILSEETAGQSTSSEQQGVDGEKQLPEATSIVDSGGKLSDKRTKANQDQDQGRKVENNSNVREERSWGSASLRGNYGSAPTGLLGDVKIKPLVDKSDVNLREERVATEVLEKIRAASPEKGDVRGWLRVALAHVENEGSTEHNMVS